MFLWTDCVFVNVKSVAFMNNVTRNATLCQYMSRMVSSQCITYCGECKINLFIIHDNYVCILFKSTYVIKTAFKSIHTCYCVMIVSSKNVALTEEITHYGATISVIAFCYESNF